MRTRAIIGTGAAAAIAAGAAVIPLMSSAQAAAGTGRPAATVHTYSFVSVEQKDVHYSQSTGAQGDTDVNAKGKIIGFDTVSFAANPKTQKITLYVAVSVPGGEIFGVQVASFSGPASPGTILGGSGAFKHVKGTFTSKDLNASGSKTAVTIKFTR
jgi:hypothetical protein